MNFLDTCSILVFLFDWCLLKLVAIDSNSNSILINLILVIFNSMYFLLLIAIPLLLVVRPQAPTSVNSKLLRDDHPLTFSVAVCPSFSIKPSKFEI